MSTPTSPSHEYLHHEFVVTHTFDAPRELVFDAWIEPRHLAQWWGPKGFTNPTCNVDVRPGGKIEIVMRAPNGTDYPMGGEYREIVPPERLVYTSGALDPNGKLLFELLHTAIFVEHAGKTTLTLTSRVIMTTPDVGKYIGGFEAGMTQSLYRLGDLLGTALKAFVESKSVPSDTSDREIVVSREYDVPRELIWEAITDPQHVSQWWGPRGFSTTIEEMDVRVGGSWKHVMNGPDGARYPNHSVFKEVTKPRRLVFAHGGHKEGGSSVQSIATWTFDAIGDGKTRVTMRMVFPSPAERDRVVREFGAVEGGKQCLERLGEHLAGK
jgi:uncharacterized protein YndB with AHSA1/START domain